VIAGRGRLLGLGPGYFSGLGLDPSHNSDDVLLHFPDNSLLSLLSADRLFLELEVTSMLLHKRTQRFCIVLLAGKDKEQKMIWVLQV
jgi:hypothetical protein